MNDKPSNSDKAYSKLYDAIRSGQLAPGARIRETEIAERVGLSRTPVRDAIKRLEAEGIIEHRPHIGAVVKSLSHQEVVELYEMRTVLERTAAAMAAKHASKAEILELRELNTAMASASDNPLEASRINELFHNCIVNAARNRFLLTSFQALSNALMVLGPTTLEGAARVKSVCDKHEAIIKALEAGDEAQASEAAATHIETSLAYRLKALRT